MDKNLTEKLGKWLSTPADKRSLEEGAELLLKLDNNRFLAMSIGRNPKKYENYIAKRLEYYYSYRLKELTHSQVKEMDQKVAKIVEVRSLESEEEMTRKLVAGRRDDHDTLPDEIIALYIENRNVLNEMRELHTRLKIISGEEHTCQDSERFPYLQRLIELDELYHSNWERYDNYKPGDAVKPVAAKKKTAKKDVKKQSGKGGEK